MNSISWCRDVWSSPHNPPSNHSVRQYRPLTRGGGAVGPWVVAARQPTRVPWEENMQDLHMEAFSITFRLYPCRGPGTEVEPDGWVSSSQMAGSRPSSVDDASHSFSNAWSSCGASRSNLLTQKITSCGLLGPQAPHFLVGLHLAARAWICEAAALHPHYEPLVL